jgi:hypothetical protein
MPPTQVSFYQLKTRKSTSSFKSDTEIEKTVESVSKPLLRKNSSFFCENFRPQVRQAILWHGNIPADVGLQVGIKPAEK